MPASPSDREKGHEHDTHTTSSLPSVNDNAHSRGSYADSISSDEVDGAWKFLNDHRDTHGVDDVDLRKLRHKVDWHIVPIMFCCYTMQFLDKVIYNVRANPDVTPSDLLMFITGHTLTCHHDMMLI